jgi:hypothetical protein
MRLVMNGVPERPTENILSSGRLPYQQLLSAVVFPTVAAPTGVMGGGGTVSGDAGFCGREVVALPGHRFGTNLALRGADTAGPEAGDRL